jgi:hypothetical protein
MLILILKVKFIMNLINFIPIEIKLDTPKNLFSHIFIFDKKQIHKNLNFQN